MNGPFRLDRALLRVSGPDAANFLNTLLTQNVEGLRETGVRYAALLSPQGKVVADMLLWHDSGENAAGACEPGVIVETDRSRGGDLLRKLTLYKLRAAVRIEEVTEKFQVLYAPEFFPGAQPDPRFPEGELGWRVISPLSSAAAAVGDGAHLYESRRLALGVPDLARDAAPEEVFALEALLEELHGVDFQKGCFVGQENVSRMKRRATTRKKFCPIVFEGEPPAPGAPVLAGQAQIGTVRTGSEGRALALLRLDRALEALGAGQSLTVAGAAVRLDPPPWLMLPQRDGEAD